MTEVRLAFEPLVALDPQITGVEYNPQLAQVAGGSDMMIVARFQLVMGATEHPLSLCLSFQGCFLPQDGRLGRERQRARPDAPRGGRTRLAAGLQEIPVDVSVRFRGTDADPLELAGLRVGDVVRLQHPAQAPLDVTAADVVFAHATPGVQGRRLAALVVAPSNQENS